MEVDDYLPISALAHVIFCERRAALVHVDGVWSNNAHTAAGNVLHERVDRGEHEHRKDVAVLRHVPLRSERLRLRGFADVVEVRETAEGRLFYPVEYKKGGPRAHRSFEVQLCAQAMALEEMTGTTVTDGALYLGATRRRRPVAFDASLRDRVTRAAARLHELVATRSVPAPVLDGRCSACSLRAACLPEAPAGTRSFEQVVRWALHTDDA